MLQKESLSRSSKKENLIQKVEVDIKIGKAT